MIKVFSTLQKTEIQDLSVFFGKDVETELSSMLSEELAKTIDRNIIKTIQKMVFDETLEERKQNAKRRIILNRMFSPPPEYFKSH